MTAPYSFLSKNGAVNGTSYCDGGCFSPDGMQLVLIGLQSIHQYRMASPWDISEFTGVGSLTVLTLGAARGPLCVAWHPSGSKIFVGGSYYKGIATLTLSTPWDITTGTWDSNFILGLGSAYPLHLCFGDSGGKMYVGTSETSPRQYTLSTPYDLSTAVYDCALANDEYGYGPPLYFSADGLRLTSADGSSVYYQTLETAWDISSASARVNEHDWVEYPSPLVEAIDFNADESRMFILAGWDTPLGMPAVWQYSSTPIVSVFWTNFFGQSETI